MELHLSVSHVTFNPAPCAEFNTIMTSLVYTDALRHQAVVSVWSRTPLFHILHMSSLYRFDNTSLFLVYHVLVVCALSSTLLFSLRVVSYHVIVSHWSSALFYQTLFSYVVCVCSSTL